MVPDVTAALLRLKLFQIWDKRRARVVVETIMTKLINGMGIIVLFLFLAKLPILPTG